LEGEMNLNPRNFSVAAIVLLFAGGVITKIGEGIGTDIYEHLKKEWASFVKKDYDYAYYEPTQYYTEPLRDYRKRPISK
jgi:hypothetical protein